MSGMHVGDLLSMTKLSENSDFLQKDFLHNRLQHTYLQQAGVIWCYIVLVTNCSVETLGVSPVSTPVHLVLSGLIQNKHMPTFPM